MVTLFGFLVVGGLGWFGAAKTVRIWAHGEHGQFLFTPLGAFLYLSVALLAFATWLVAERAGATSTRAALPLLFVIPVLVFPYGIYLSGLAIELGTRFFSQTRSLGEVRTYDRGDGALARREFAAAADYYRQDLARWPGDGEALLRLARALEAGGAAGEAAQVLTHARLELLGGQGGSAGNERVAVGAPGFARRDRQERVVLLTYALGDLYEGPLHAPEQAAALYAETIELLFGFRDVNPLRQRLARLRLPGGQPATHSEAPVPDRLTLD